jgi:hypothetical protein
MQASKLIIVLQKIIEKHGDLAIVGGQLHDDTPLREVKIIDSAGREIWPHNVNGIPDDKIVIDGIWLSH